MKPVSGLYAPVAMSSRSATFRASTVRDGSAAASSSAALCSSPAITRLTSVPPCAAIGVVSALTTQTSCLLVHVWSRHSVLAVPLHRPPGSASPGAVGRVHGEHAILLYPWSLIG